VPGLAFSALVKLFSHIHLHTKRANVVTHRKAMVSCRNTTQAPFELEEPY
jgi:hypothetical protein